MNDTSLPSISFGPNGPAVSRIGLGGEGILRTFGEEAGATAVIEEALKQGITYFDTAPAYSGSEDYLGAVWKERPNDCKRIFQTSKSAHRSGQHARQQLETTLKKLGRGHLDLWQIHDVRTEEEIERIAGPGGALEAFVQAKAEGLVRKIGVTGHHDPDILLRCIREWPVDSVLFPVNPPEGGMGGFLPDIIDAARAKGIATIGMKVFGGGHYIFPQGKVTPELLLRYALSHPVDVLIVGCAIPDHVRTLTKTLRGFIPMPPEAMEELHASFRPHSSRLAFYRGPGTRGMNAQTEENS